MIEHVEGDAVRRQATRLLLAVNKRNHKAIMAYHKHGFRIEKSVTKPIGMGFEMDDYIMVKAVNPNR